ncbi:MAG: hypothetical protein IKU37_08655 [Candidatus Gastranaerophilales bacterium]|nr:hypothetical protein [Candidatus Gastranaerophilales bacterium]
MEKQQMKSTLKQLIEMYAKYLTEDCYDNEDKQFFYEQSVQCLAKLMAL